MEGSVRTHRDLVPPLSAEATRIEVRPLAAAESGEYRLLRLECLRLHDGLFGTTAAEEEMKPELYFERAIREQDPDRVMLGAFVEGRLSGLCGLLREIRLKTRHRAELVQMFVSRRAAGLGLGDRLVAAHLRLAFTHPEITQVILGVVSTNEAALRLYRRHGFVEYGRLSAYFRFEGRDSTQLFLVRERTAAD